MHPHQTRVIGIGLLFLFIFISGFWLSRLGRPYSGLILTLHKLLSLAALILLVIIIYKVHQTTHLEALAVMMSLICGLFFVGTIVTGGLLSTGRSAAPLTLTLHQIAPFLTLLFAGVTLYLLLFRR